jgi:hypothetical protein
MSGLWMEGFTVTKNVCNFTVVRHDDHVIDPPALSVFSIISKATNEVGRSGELEFRPAV